MSKLSVLAATAAALPLLAFSGTALADTTGQIEGGDIYRVRNTTTNSAFADSIAAACGDTVQFRVRVHNPGPDALNNVKVSATLNTDKGTSHSSKVTVTADNANPTTTTATAGVTTSSATTLSFVNGSTELLDASENKMSTLPDTILTSGVNIDTVGVSTLQKRLVQFSAKVNCETPTTPSKPTTPAAPSKPTKLVNTGAGSVAGIFAGVAAVAALGYNIVLRRQNAR